MKQTIFKITLMVGVIAISNYYGCKNEASKNQNAIDSMLTSSPVLDSNVVKTDTIKKVETLPTVKK